MPIVNGYAAAFARFIAGDLPPGSRTGVYFEFANVANSSITIPPAAIDLTEGVEYYTALGLTSDRDFLRVSTTMGSVSSTDADFPEGNTLNIVAQTAGDQGVFSRPYSNAANSLLYAAAVVIIVDPQDRTKDLLIYREHFPELEQQVKPVGSHQYVSLNIEFS